MIFKEGAKPPLRLPPLVAFPLKEGKRLYCSHKLKSAKLSVTEVYYEKIHQDNIRGYPGSGYDLTYEVPGAVHILSYFLSYTPELHP
jgi:hypothetical protein